MVSAHWGVTQLKSILSRGVVPSCVLYRSHVDHDSLPDELQGTMLRTPIRDRQMTPSAPASPKKDTTKVQSPGTPIIPIRALDI